jgi:hypothetical protein
MELPLDVAESLLEIPVSLPFDLSEEPEWPESLRYPVTLVFYDKRYALHGEILKKLFDGRGERADFRIARMYAMKELDFIDEDMYIQTLRDITQPGIASLLPYSEGDYTLTALIALAAPELINIPYTAALFEEKLNDRNATPEEISASYLGLAALSKPVLLDIKELLNDPEGLAKEDRLRLVAALAALGDDDAAALEYDKIELEVSLNGNQEETIKIFALRLLTASRLNLPEAENMAAYLAGNLSNEQTVVLELMAFQRYYQPYAEGEAVFGYSLNGSPQTVTLDRYRGTMIRFSKDMLDKADFNVTEGEVTGFYFYTGTIADLESNPHIYTEPSLKMEKTVTPVDGSGPNSGPGALYEVKLQVAAGSAPGFYSFEDMIPSGARFAGVKDNGIVTRSGQRVSASLYYNPDAFNTRSVSYFIRLAIPGEYVQEPTVVYDTVGNWGKTERGVFTVAP